MISTLTIAWIALIIGAFFLFQSALKLLSTKQREAFLQEKLFSGPYLWIVFILLAGMSMFDDLRIILAVGALALACAAYEHWKNHTNVNQLDLPDDFKARIRAISWIVDAVVILVAADAVLSHLNEVTPPG